MVGIALLPSENVPRSVEPLVNWTQDDRLQIRVRNQGRMNACWAFAATTAYEYSRAIKFPRFGQKPFSPQQLVDCVHQRLTADMVQDDRGGYLCTLNRAFRWIVNHGIALERQYPYRETKRRCCEQMTSNKNFRMSGYQTINEADEEELLKQIGKQPVAAGIDIFESFLLLRDGIYRGPAEGEKYEGGHAVVILGYGRDPETLEEVFLVQSSWGEEWGVNGIGKVKRGVPPGGVNFLYRASYPVLT